jgi:TonB-linked SusC/RagA family outer membrane protein
VEVKTSLNQENTSGIQGGNLTILSSDSESQQNVVTGTVTDASTGEPMPGVNIQVKGTTIGTITDAAGKYSLSVTDRNVILVFSFIGYSTREVPVAGKSVVDMILDPELTGLEEVIVIGYGTMRKSDLTGSVVRADIESFRESPNVSVMQSLQGSVAGLNVGQIDRSGEEPSILIRGLSSLSGETRPLIVVDNVIFRGNLIDLNPNDIESIDILKDASSAAIYGSQATNGVILITTTKSGGLDGKPTIKYSGYYSFQSPVKELGYLDAEGFYKKTDESAIETSRTAESGYLDPNPAWQITNVFSTNEEIEAYNDGRMTNWYNELTNNNMYTQNHNLSLSNRTKYNNYLVSVGYTDQKGYLLNEDYSRLNARINLDNNITDWLKIGIQSFLTASDYSGQEATPNDRYSSPYATAYDRDGELIQIVAGNVINPFIKNMADDLDKRLNLFGNIFADVSIPFIEGLTYRFNFANNYRTTSEYYFRPYGSSFQGQGSKAESIGYDWSSDNILTYKRDFNNIHNLNVTLVYGLEKRNLSSVEAVSSVFSSFELGYNMLEAGSSELQQTYSGAWEEASLYSMGRVFYGYKNKYLFTGTIRRDGFSGFGEENKFGFFPSMSIAWVVTEEPFLKGTPLLNNLKIRASYGSVGNRTIGRYQTLAKVSGGFNYVTSLGTSVYTQSINSLASPNLKWETTTGLNFGIDFGILKFLSGAIDYYNNNTTDLLYNVDIPAISRFQKFPDNLGKLHNHGLEISLTSVNLRKSDFEWTTSFVFSRNRNELKELLGFDIDGDGKEDDLISEGLFIGESIDAIYDYKIDGKWQVGEVIPPGFDLGGYKTVDFNKDESIGPNDRTILGYRNPAYRFSINNSLVYKNWVMKFFINSIQGGKNFYLDEDTYRSFSVINSEMNYRFNFPEGIDYWTPENPNARYHRPNISVADGLEGRLYAQRNFVRLQDISLSYDFSENIKNTLRLQNLRLYFSGKNLLTLTKWNGWDPETGESIDRGGLPVIKSFTFGVDVEF